MAAAAVLAVLVVAGTLLLRTLGSHDVPGVAVAAPTTAPGPATSMPTGTTVAATTVTVTATTATGVDGAAVPDLYRGYADTPGAAPTRHPGDDGVYFTSPSGNIHCAVRPGGDGGSAICSIDQRDWAPTPKPASCPANWADNHVAVDQAGAVSGQCLGGVEVPPVAAVLPYGRTVTANGVSCSSAETGITCRYEATGHGFTLRRAALELF